MWKRLGAAGVLAAPAWAQCSMCRTAAAAAGGAGAMNAAIVVLFVPAVALFCGVFVLALRGESEQGEAAPRRAGGKRPAGDRG